MLHWLDLGNVRASTNSAMVASGLRTLYFLHYENTGEGTGLRLSSLGEAPSYRLKFLPTSLLVRNLSSSTPERLLLSDLITTSTYRMLI
jgi:hypothetical protein